MRLVVEFSVCEPACRDLGPDHGRELAAWRRVLQGVAEATDGLLATRIQPFLGLTDAFITALYHRYRGCGLLLARRRRGLPGAPHEWFRLCHWWPRLRQPGQLKTAGREEV